MTHIWLRAEQRPDESRTGLTPEGVARLIAAGHRLTVERSATRVLPDDAYAATGAAMAPEGSWPDAPRDAVVLGLKELPEDGRPLVHRHVMFGHAYKGQPAGRDLLRRFRAGGGTLYDLEYLTDEDGRRVAAFGYWAGYAGAALSLLAWAAQRRDGRLGAVAGWPDAETLAAEVRAALDGLDRPGVLIIGALGRVGTGAADLARAAGLRPTGWDQEETAGGGPFPEVLAHEVFLNCILARPGTPVFVPRDAGTRDRRLGVVGDIACDPSSDFSPVPVYDRATTWADPVIRVHDAPPLDVMAIDNLPSLLPAESSQDFARQLLPHLTALDAIDRGVWGRAEALFHQHADRA